MPGTFSEDYSSSSVKVFLGGTCNNSQWRDRLKKELIVSVGWFDPVVPDWKPEDQVIERQVRESSDYTLYVISPLMTGVYSIAEVVDDSHRRPNQTPFTLLDSELGTTWTTGERRSLDAVAEMLKRNGAIVLDNLAQVADFLNTKGIELATTPSMEAKKWSDDVTKKEKWHPPEDFFKKSASSIANGLIKASKDKRQAIARLQFYINRAGKNLSTSDKKKLDTAKLLIQKHYDKLTASKEDRTDKTLTVVIIQGNPKYIRGNPTAKAFYESIRKYLESAGCEVSFDPGEPYTLPKTADIWIGHSRGTDRLRFAPKTVTVLAFGSSIDGAINHPEDNAVKKTWKGEAPNAYHFTFTDEMRSAIDKVIAGTQQPSVSQEDILPPSAKW